MTINGSAKSLSAGRLWMPAGIAAAVVMTVAACAVVAAPQNPRVVRGRVNIAVHGPNTVIRASNNSIINYSRFDVAADETVRFMQPSKTSRVLNRILSSEPTHIDGRIMANGIVYFVNPAGVLFGPDSIINVGTLYAAGANISNRSFVAGVDRFTDASGNVVNRGRIYADAVNLIGRQVANHGSIVATADSVMLVSGDDVMIGDRGGRIFVRLSGAAADAVEGVGVENTGSIRAAGGVQLSAGDMYSLAIRNTGAVTAPTIKIDGRGGAVQVGGTLNAGNTISGMTGGAVSVLGEYVSVLGATIDASGPAGGGTVLIGGDYQGGGRTPTAQTTIVDSNTVITADALVRGDGGKVIVWADGATQFTGAITAKGGPAGGDGGFVETSGLQYLFVSGSTVDASAPAGSNGTWLLDPTDITIQAAATSGTMDIVGDPWQDDGSNAAAATVNTADIVAALRTGTDVNITSVSGGAGTGTITVADAISPDLSFTADNTAQDVKLTLIAAADIVVNAAINTSGSDHANDHLSVDLQSTTGVDINAAINTLGGTFDSSATGGAGTFDATHGSASITTGAGSVVIDHTGGVNFGATTIGGDLTVTAGEAITDPAMGITVTGAASFTTKKDAGAAITMDSVLNSFGAVTARALNAAGNAAAAGDITLKEQPTMDITVVETAGAVTILALNDANVGSITAGTTVVFTAAGTINDAAADALVDITAGGAITLGAANGIGGGEALELASGSDVTATVTATGDIALNSLGAVTLTDIGTSDGTITIAAQGSITATDVQALGAGQDVNLSTTSGGITATLVSAPDAVTLTADAGDISIGAVTATGGAVDITATTGAINDATGDAIDDITAGGLITLTARNEIGGLDILELAAGSSVNASSTTGDIVLDSPGAITLTDVDTVDGGITVTADGLITATDVVAAGAGQDVSLTTTAGGIAATLVTAPNAVTLTADAGDITVGAMTATAGTVDITATLGSINDAAADAIDDITAGGLITLTARDEIGGVETLELAAGSSVNASSTTAGDIVLDTSGAIILTDVDTVDGGITVTADGLITATDVVAAGAGQDVSLTTTAGGIAATLVTAPNAVTLTADAGDITVGAVTATAGTVDITATLGSINDAAADAIDDITAGGLITLTARDEIGGAETLELAAGSSVNASSTTAGDIVLDTSGAIILTNVDTVDGDITVTAGGLITATDVQTGEADDDISLTTTAGGVAATLVTANDTITITADAGDVTVDDVTAGTTVAITATTGAIEEMGDDAAADITGTDLTLTAAGGIGAAGTLDTASDSLDMSVTGAGNIDIRDIGGTRLVDVDTADGDIRVTSDGDLAIDDVAAGGGTITLIADDDDSGVGDLVFQNPSTVATTDDITLKGADIDISPGSVNTTFGIVTLLSSNGRSIGLGDGAGDMTITGADLQQITAGVLIVGDGTTGSVVVDNVTAANTAGINLGTQLTATGAGETVTFSGTGSVFSSALTVDATDVYLDTDVFTVGEPIRFSGPVEVRAHVKLDTTNANAVPFGDGITFDQTLDGAFNVTFDASTDGDILFTGVVGGGTPLADVTIDRAADVTAGAFSAASLTQTAGTGTTTFNGAVIVTGAPGVSLTGTDFVSNVGGTIVSNGNDVTISQSGALTVADTITAGAGAVDLSATGATTLDAAIVSSGSASLDGGTTAVNAGITSTGTVDVDSTNGTTIAAAGAINAGGAVTIGGGGATPISTAGNVTTTGDLVTFSDATTTTGAVAIDTGAGAGNVVFASTLALGADANITAGTGNVTFTGQVDATDDALTVASSDITTITAGVIGTTAAIDIGATTRTDVDGAIALTGAGTVELDNAIVSGVDVTTVGGDITFDGAASTDTGAVAIGTGAGAGDVLFNNTLTLGDDVTVTGGTGNVTFTGQVDAADKALTVASSGITTITAGIIGTTATIDIGATTQTDVDGAIALSGAGTVELDRAIVSGVNVTTVGGNITFDGAASTDTGAVAVGTGGAGGDVLFNNTLALGEDLTITAGTGTVTFTGQVDATDDALTVASSDITTITGGIIGTTAAIDIAATTRTDVDGTIALTGAGTVELDKAVVSGVDVTTVGGNITFDGAASTDTGAVAVGTGAGGGDVLFNNTLTLAEDLTITAGTGTVTFTGQVDATDDALTVASSDITTITAGVIGTTAAIDIGATTQTDVDGAIALSGAGTVELDRAIVSGVDITTVGGNITFDGAASTDTGAVAVGTGGAGGDVLFNNTLTLGDDVTITGGTGNVTFTGQVDAADKVLTVASSDTTTITGGIIGTTATIDIVAATQTDVDGAIALSGAGTVELDKAIVSGVSITTVGGDITFDGAASTDTGAVAVGTGAGGGDVLFNNTLTLAEDLTITAGTGTVAFTGQVDATDDALTVASSDITTITAGIIGTTATIDIGATTRTDVDGAIALTGAGTVELDNAIVSGVNVTTAGGNITFDGPATTDIGAVAVGTGAGGGDVLFNNTLTLGDDVTITGGTGNVTFTGQVDADDNALTVVSSDITTITGGVIGTTATIDVAATTQTDVDGAIALIGAGTVELDRAIVSGVDITTVGGDITFDGAASTDTGPVAIGTGGGAGDVEFTNTLTLGDDVTITAGTGNVTFTGQVDAADKVLTVASSDTTTISTGVSGTTATIDIAAATQTDVDGAIALSGAGTVEIDNAIISGVDITTVGGDITFDGAALTDTGAVAIGVGVGGGDVLFNNTLTLGDDVTITAGTGNVTFTGQVDAADKALTVASSDITTITGGIIGTTATIDIVAATQTDVDGAIALTGAGTVELDRAIVSGVDITTVGGNITFDGAASTDTGAVAVGTGAGAGDVLFNNTLTLGDDVTITGGTGNVTFTGQVDAADKALTVASSDITTITGGIIGTTATIDIVAATQTDVDGAIALSGAGTVELDRAIVSGVDITTVGGNITFDGAASTDTGAVAIGTGAAGGDVLFNSTLALGDDVTITAGTGNVTFTGQVDAADKALTVVSSDITTITGGVIGTTAAIDIGATTRTDVDGAIALSGAGTVELDRAIVSGVDITTVGGDITFDGAASTDTGPVAIGTGAGAGDVEFNNTLTLGDDATITAGTGNVTFTGQVDAADKALTVASSDITTITAGIIGTTATIDIGATTQTDVDGAIALTGAGTVELDRAIVSGVDVTTVGGDITFDGAASTDTGAVAIGTGAGAGDVLFNNTLALGDDVTITAGAGNVTFTGQVDAVDHALTVVSSDITTITGGIIGATAVIDVTATTRTDVDGAITLAGAGTVELDKAIVSGVDVTTVGGDITFDGAASTDTGPVTVSTGAAGAGDVLFNNTLDLGDDITVTAGTGLATFTGLVDAADNQVTVTSASVATFTVGATNLGGLSVTAEEIDLDGGVDSMQTGSAPAVVVLQPMATSTAIKLGFPTEAGGSLELTDAELAALADGFASITIGRADGAHAIDIQSAAFRDPVTIQAPVGVGQITVGREVAGVVGITGTDDASITLDGPGATTYLDADITTDGADVTISDSVVVRVDALIDTTTGPGSVDIYGTIEDDTNLRTLTITAGTGDVTLRDTVGATNELLFLDVTGELVTLGGNVWAGDVTVTGQDIDFDGQTIITSGGVDGFGVVKLLNRDAGQPINLGSGAPALGLSSNELQSVTADMMLVGTPLAGPVTIDAPVTLVNVPTLTIDGGALTDTGTGGLAVDNLVVITDSAVLDGDNDVDHLAAAIPVAGGAFMYHDVDDLHVTTIESLPGVDVVGITTKGGDVTLLSDGLLALPNADQITSDQPITTTADADTVQASGTVTIEVAGIGHVNLGAPIDTTGSAHATLGGNASGDVEVVANNGNVTVVDITTDGGAGAAAGGAGGAVELESNTGNVDAQAAITTTGGAGAAADGGAGGAVTMTANTGGLTAVAITTDGGAGAVNGGAGGTVDLESNTGDVDAQAAVSTVGGAGAAADGGAGGAVTMTANTGQVDVDDIITSGGVGGGAFAGGVGGDIAVAATGDAWAGTGGNVMINGDLTALGGMHGDGVNYSAGGVISLQPDEGGAAFAITNVVGKEFNLYRPDGLLIFADGATVSGEEVRLAPAGRTLTPGVATITAVDNLTISGNIITMGRGEKLTVTDGSVTFIGRPSTGVDSTVSVGMVTLGDVSAKTNINVIAQSGPVQLRRAVRPDDNPADTITKGVISSNGSVYKDPVVDFVARDGSIDFTGPHSVTVYSSAMLFVMKIGGEVPQGGVDDEKWNVLKSPVLEMGFTTMIDMDGDGGSGPVSVTLDLPSTPFEANPATALAGAVPRVWRDVNTDADAITDNAVLQDLWSLGIPAKDLTVDERRQRIETVFIFNDQPTKQEAKREDYTVSVPRLSGSLAIKALALYREVFFLGEERVDQAPVMRASIQAGLDAFKAAAVAEAFTVEAFRAYLTEASDGTAQTYVAQIEELYGVIRLLGLSHKELSNVNMILLSSFEGLTYDGEAISTEELEQLFNVWGVQSGLNVRQIAAVPAGE